VSGLYNEMVTVGYRASNSFTFAFWGNDLDSEAQTITNEV
jgi:hypothetical protein